MSDGIFVNGVVMGFTISMILHFTSMGFWIIADAVGDVLKRR
jgi:hypothetical protein